MPSSFKLTGEREMLQRMRRQGALVITLAKQAMRVEAESVMTVSKQDRVPVDLGTLRSSGKVSDVEWKGGKLSITMSYGGAAIDYAIVVHETPDYDPYSWRVGDGPTFKRGGPKYLERPLLEALPGMGQRIANVVRQAFN